MENRVGYGDAKRATREATYVVAWRLVSSLARNKPAISTTPFLLSSVTVSNLSLNLPRLDFIAQLEMAR
jgi:hypothetical protein